MSFRFAIAQKDSEITPSDMAVKRPFGGLEWFDMYFGLLGLRRNSVLREADINAGRFGLSRFSVDVPQVVELYLDWRSNKRCASARHAAAKARQ